MINFFCQEPQLCCPGRPLLLERVYPLGNRKEFVSRLVYGPGQILYGNLPCDILYRCLFRGKIDVCAGDAGDTAQGLLHLLHARGARHPANGHRYPLFPDAVAQILDRLDKICFPELDLGIKGDRCLFRGKVDGSTTHPLHAGETLLDCCHTAGTAHPRDGQLDPLAAACGVTVLFFDRCGRHAFRWAR